MPDEMFYKLGAQVMALELVIKTMIAMQLASTVKSETGFVEAAETAVALGERLQSHVRKLAAQVVREGHDGDVGQIMLTSMEETVGRCFAAPAANLREIADLILEGLKPASDAKN